MQTGERRTLIVVAITALTMVVEIAAGIAFGSMALLADGLHMASHAAALGLAVIAYVFARRYAADRRFSFGTGKVNALAGFSSALLLGVFAVLMVWESGERLFQPISIAFDQAIIVAVLGLLVNGASMLILGGAHKHTQQHQPEHTHVDHNLRGAYLHVLADTLTSCLAIVALLAGKYFGAVWMDPAMGLVGAVLVARWSWRLIHDSGRILLDMQAPPWMLRRLKEVLEQRDGDRVTDLHLWPIGPGINAASVAIVSHDPESPQVYRQAIPSELGIVHTTIEVHQCPQVGASLAT